MGGAGRSCKKSTNVNSQLIIDVDPKNGQTKIALLEDSKLVEYRTDNRNSKGFSLGDIYVGVVTRVMPSLNASFIDIGHKHQAFLHYNDLGLHVEHMLNCVKRATKTKVGSGEELLSLFTPAQGAQGEDASKLPKDGKISNYLKHGQLVIVQIAREAYASKGPSLTTDISLAGRNMVLTPFDSALKMSSKLRAQDEAKRLNILMRSILPEGFGAIVRTAAAGKTVQTLNSELEELLGRWRAALEQLSAPGKFPRRLLSELNASSALIRDNLNGSYSEIDVNDRELYDEIRSYLSQIDPGAVDMVKLYTSKRVPIFDQYDVTKQVRRSLGRTVDFHKGSYLIIEHTEALHVIDVNSGSGSKNAASSEESAFEVNFAACDEIARQLRLRDIGGIIVIDFIDMRSAENRKTIYDRMRELLARGKVTHKVLPLTDFGLMQITRQRRGPDQRVDVSEKCPSCNGTGRIDSAVTLEEDILAQYILLAEKKLYKMVELRVHPFVEAYFTVGLFSRRRKMVQKYGLKLRVQGGASYPLLKFDFFDEHGDQIML